MSRQANLQSLNPAVKLNLFTIDFTEAITFDGSGPSILRVTNERNAIVFDGNTYNPESISFVPSVIEFDGKLPQSRLRIWGRQTTLLSAFNAYGALNKTQLTRITIFEDDLASPSEAKTTVWSFDEKIITKSEARFVLTKSDGLEKLLDVFLPILTQSSFS